MLSCCNGGERYEKIVQKETNMAKSIMVQGTMSNVGKSVIATGLCRIFWQDGYKVAPFKSQNMALNSYITKDNLEMGRAQVVQAEACNIEPSVCMNPILLKPVTDMGSQVIVMGEVVGNMRAMEYFKRKKEYIPVIKKAYDTLADEYDIIVIEGAGSPAEINLKKDDIVNMGMAELADASVLLVGDIDRGGVFAQLIGTVDLLEPEEQNRIKGLLINKFRGDKSILSPGLDMIYERCGKEVLGVVPYTELDIDDEDSLSETLNQKKMSALLDIAVIQLPKISNFTDFRALEMEPMVSVRYVRKPWELKQPDMVILPGTKNTMKDMKWLRKSGMEAAISKLGDILIFGICGGYQILGEEIVDTTGIEDYGKVRGMGLLPIITTFETKKTRSRVEGCVAKLEGELSCLSGAKVCGYEIHMGQSRKVEKDENKDTSLPEGYFLCIDGALEGYRKGRVMGSYLHGIFDEEEFRRGILEILCKKRDIQLEFEEEQSYQEYKESQYDKLADVLREHVDMKRIYRILGL